MTASTPIRWSASKMSFEKLISSYDSIKAKVQSADWTTCRTPKWSGSCLLMARNCFGGCCRATLLCGSVQALGFVVVRTVRCERNVRGGTGRPIESIFGVFVLSEAAYSGRGYPHSPC